MASLESQSTFEGGMSSDNSKFAQQPNTYLEALNFRLTTTLGGSNNALVNIKGNEYKTTIPATQPVYKLKSNTASYGTSVTVTINGITSISLVNNAGTQGFDIYQLLTTIVGFGTTFFASYYQGHAVIWSTTINPIPTLSSAGLLLDTQYGGGSWIASQANLIPIGTTYIRDDIYVFTTPLLSTPNTAPNAGQIFKLTYDVVTKIAVLTLVYNGYVNFNTTYPIPYTAAHGRYESDLIQRLYWTDNYNKLRSVNAVDSNLMAFPVSLLDIFPQVNSFMPTLQSVEQTGGLLCGVYQYAYRLKKSNGQTTLWSELSLPIPIYNNIPEAGYTGGTGGLNGWGAYVGNAPGSNTNKSITCKIAKVDYTFDFVDICFVSRFSYNDPGAFEIFSLNQPIVAGQPIPFIHTGKELNNIPLTLLDFLLTSPGFTHCKTIDTKDNRLFVGNVRIEQEDLVYDSRAYQFPSMLTQTTLVNNGLPYTIDSSLGFTIAPGYTQQVPETDDAINENYTFTTPATATNTQRFYPGTTIPGGKGPNIEFKVKSHAIHIDVKPLADFNNPGYFPSPWRHTVNGQPTSINLGVDQVDYPQGTPYTINDSMKTVYKSFLLRGYTPNEIYRFGIQFFDKQGSPYFCKWIADIRMPDYTDDYPGGEGLDLDGQVLNLLTTYTPIGNQNNLSNPPVLLTYMQIPYLEFVVDVSSIIDSISGFEIVRVEKSETDRVIAGTGILYQSAYGNGGNTTHIYIPDTVSEEFNNSHNPEMYLSGTGNGAEIGSATVFTFDCWDFQSHGYPVFDPTNDRIHTCGGTTRPHGFNGPGYTQAPGNPNDGYYWSKQYNWQVIAAPNQLGVDLAMITYNPIDREQIVGVNGGYTFENFHVNELVNPTARISIGNPTLLVELSAPFIYSDHIGSGTPTKLFCEYRKYGRLVTQYGGRTYANRANNVYISTGSYVPANDASIVSANSITLDVFGGDTFYGIYAKQKLDKNVNHQFGSDLVKSYIHFNPHIGYHNPDIRNGQHFEGPNPITGISYITESYSHHDVYSIENNIKKFFPKPLLFNQADEWDNRVHFSEVKFNGEISDSWENFKVNNYWDVEGSYGPINSLIVYQDTLYFIQKKGFGKLYVNPMAIVNTGNFGAVTLGLGDTIQKHDYISTDVGTSHQWSVTRSPNSLLFVDSTNKKVFKYNNSGLLSISDAYGQRNTFVRLLHDDILNNDNPILFSGIHCTYDYFHDEYLISILNRYTDSAGVLHPEFNTISFNEKVDRWNSFYGFVPAIYLSNRTQLWSPSLVTVDDLYIHNNGKYATFYGATFPSTIKLLSNPNGKYTKLFNNLVFNTEAIKDSTDYNPEGNTNIFNSTFDTFRAYNDYQNTDFLILTPGGVSPTIRRVERQWNLQMPRNKVLYSVTASPNIFTDIGNKLYGERMRDKYLTVDLSYNNSNNYRLIFNNLQTKYLISDR